MRKKKVLTIVLSFLAVLITCAIYLFDGYKADDDAISAFVCEVDVSREVITEGVVYMPKDAVVGLVFYGGGKVEHSAYEPLAAALAERGILTVIVEMPFNLAVLDVKAADGIQEKYPEIESWYIGGHSLGGSMAAAYLGENADDFEGLVLLGSYSTEDLSDTDLKVLSVYGSEDKVMNREKYDENKTNLPDDFTEIVIEGGCHAYFGMYGNQEGDGTPAITPQEQIEITAEKIAEAEGDENEAQI